MACCCPILQVKLFVGNAAKYIYQDDALQIPGRFPNDEVCYEKDRCVIHYI